MGTKPRRMRRPPGRAGDNQRKQIVTIRLPPATLERAKAAAAADDRTLSYYLAKLITQAFEH